MLSAALMAGVGATHSAGAEGDACVALATSLEQAKPDTQLQQNIALFSAVDKGCMPIAQHLLAAGALVEAEAEPNLPVIQVRATRGKYVRAEPVAMLYSQGKVKHVGAQLAALEDELCDFGPDGLSSGASPDRLDALAWAVTALTARGWEGPRIRSFGDDPLPSPSILRPSYY